MVVALHQQIQVRKVNWVFFIVLFSRFPAICLPKGRSRCDWQQNPSSCVAPKGTMHGTHLILGTREREELEEWDPRQTRTLGRRNLGSHGTRRRRRRGYPDFGTEGLRVSLPACRWGGPQCRRDVTLHRELQGVGAHPHRGAQRAQQGGGRLVRAVLPAAGLGRSLRGDGEEHGASGLPRLDRLRPPTAPRFSFSWDAFVVI